MTMTFQEAMDKINSGIILACPVCLDGREIDEEGERMYCHEHGEYVTKTGGVPTSTKGATESE
ncbi:MAG: hypothetical protein ACYCZS_08710 [Thiobacillus sp.]